MRPVFTLTALFVSCLAPAALSAQDVSGAPFKEGDVIGFDQLDRIEKYLPKEFWDNRDFFFYEGMKLTIGPAYVDYSPAEAYVAATKANSDKVSLGPESSLVGYVNGQPFPTEKIDCKGDPGAGAKIAWNFDRRW